MHTEASDEAPQGHAMAPLSSLDPDAEARDRGRRGSLYRGLVAGVVIVVLAVLVAGLVVSQRQLSDQRSLNRDRLSAMTSAKLYATEVASYDYRHLAHDFGTVELHSTLAFRKTFESSSKALAKVLVQYHATARASVLATGVESLTSSRAVVLLFVNQTVSNTAQKGSPTRDNSRIRMTMVRSGSGSGSGWLIEQVQLL